MRHCPKLSGRCLRFPNASAWTKPTATFYMLQFFCVVSNPFQLINFEAHLSQLSKVEAETLFMQLFFDKVFFPVRGLSDCIRLKKTKRHLFFLGNSLWKVIRNVWGPLMWWGKCGKCLRNCMIYQTQQDHRNNLNKSIKYWEKLSCFYGVLSSNHLRKNMWHTEQRIWWSGGPVVGWCFRLSPWIFC